MNNINFTYDCYTEILTQLNEQECNWINYRDSVDEHSVILRHDIDYSPRKALQIATIEANHGVTATYFFLIRSPYYNIFEPKIAQTIRSIENMGHNIGLHFSTHAHWDLEPVESELIKEIRKENQLLGSVAESVIPTIAFHNPPDWTINRTFDGIVSTYEPRFFNDINYVADSNQRWRDSNPFISLSRPVQILVHPVLWGKEPGSVRDRLREERDYMTVQIESKYNEQNPIWDGDRGVNSDS